MQEKRGPRGQKSDELDAYDLAGGVWILHESVGLETALELAA